MRPEYRVQRTENRKKCKYVIARMRSIRSNLKEIASSFDITQDEALSFCPPSTSLGTTLSLPKGRRASSAGVYTEPLWFGGLLAMTISLIILFASAAFAVENAEEAEFSSAKKAFEQGNFSKAVYEFDMILNSRGSGYLQDGALYWSGEAYLKMGDYRKALEYYDKIVGSFPSSHYYAFAVYSKGYAYYKLGMYEDAINCYGEVAGKFPFEKVAVESLFRTGECEYLLGRYADVERDLAAFIEKYPVSDRTAEAHYMLGEERYYQAKFADALKSFSKALAIAPKAAWAAFAIYRMADAEFRLGEYAKSVESFKRANATGAGEFLESESLLGLCRNYEKMGLSSEAKIACDNLISKYPTSDAAAGAYCVKARLFLNEGRFIEAAGLCREAIEKYKISPALDNLHYELGLSYAGQGRQEEGLREFEWVKAESKDVSLVTASLCKAGDIFLEMSDYRKALENYDAVLDKYPEGPNADYAQYQIGNSYFTAGKFQQAAMAYHGMLANFPNSSLREKAVFRLGASYYRMKDYVHAGQEFSGLLKDYPASARAKLYLADSLYNMNKYDEALFIYRDVERDNQDGAITAKALYQTGWCYYNMRKEAEAVGAFARFLREYPSSELALDARYWFGGYYRSKGDLEKARDYFGAILKEYPASDIADQAAFSLALTLAEEGKAGEAVTNLEKAASGSSDTALTGKFYREIAQVLERLNRLDEAARLYEKLAAMGTDESKFAKERLDRIRLGKDK
jgi:TolA-binding protein